MRKRQNIKLSKTTSILYYGYVDLDMSIDFKIETVVFCSLGYLKIWKEYVEILENAMKLSANTNYKVEIQNKINHFYDLIEKQELYNYNFYKKEELLKKERTDKLTPIVLNAMEQIIPLEDSIFDMLYENNGKIHDHFGFASHGFIKIEHNHKTFVFNKGLAPEIREIEDYDSDTTLGGFNK